MTSEERAKQWVADAKRRAILIENASPMANRKRKAKLADLTPAAPEWFEPNPMRYPIQDGDMLIVGKWFKRQPVAGILPERKAA